MLIDSTLFESLPAYTVEPGTKVDLAAWETSAKGPYEDKEIARAELELIKERIEHLQERLWAEHQQSLLVVLQAMDTGGKDGTIRNVFSGINPAGCRVWSFKQPTSEELDRDFLWRIHQRTPAKGMINVFNRSHYEDVLVVRVDEIVPEQVWRKRYELINDFEKLLVENGTAVLKIFLHISREEQRERLQARLDDPAKHWKFAVSDLDDRARWDDFQEAYADAVTHCSTEHAPWHIIPADRKWYRDVVVAKLVADTLERMDPQFPASVHDLDGIVIPE